MLKGTGKTYRKRAQWFPGFKHEGGRELGLNLRELRKEMGKRSLRQGSSRSHQLALDPATGTRTEASSSDTEKQERPKHHL